ncbi:type VI secretion system Vgr family protein [Hyalangium versicolor]|uniref:type VI secretion system Vgr family protein n=1 Tax=Hyalangium versicolor TaxID=2861190 RepID=UPI001CCED286|nr:type VI secretion system tip protein VgrG [Hyalangium versicolor]
MRPASALTASEPEFEFEAGPFTQGELAVVEFEAREGLSSPYRVDLIFTAEQDIHVDAAELLGQPAALVVHQGDDIRYLHGVLCELSRWNQGGGPQRNRYRAVLEPRFHQLRHTRRSRIFQQKTIPEIIQELLDAGKVKHSVELQGSYSPRNYCVQYRESDFDFISRLMEEVGIFYFFRHEQGEHEMVLGDSPQAHTPILGDPLLPFRDPAGMAADEECVYEMTGKREVVPGAVALRDFDFVRPSLDMSVDDQASDGDTALEVYDYPGKYEDPGPGRDVAKIRLEELRATGQLAWGQCQSRRMMPGYKFELTNHAEPELNREFLLLSVHHEGFQPEVLLFEQQQGGNSDRKPYRSTFHCMPSDVPYRPARRTPRPVIPGPQTAIVVGPSGEEIHTDEHGRVKVQFHWDREAPGDDKSSCWIRVSQAWAGPGWGALYLPRIGQEVVVDFLEGDPDRPLITGRVYNGHNPPPADLPAKRTQSTLRSDSSPTNGGFNELRFEDAAGEEQIFLHGQKDLDIVIENDKGQSIGGNETLTVAKDRERAISGNQSLKVQGNDETTVIGNQSVEVKSNRDTTVAGNHTETVGGSQSIEVGGTHTLSVALASAETIGLAKALNVGGAYAVTVGAAMNVAVVGVKAEEVGGSKSELVGAQKTEKIAGSRTLTVGKEMTETVGESRTLEVGKDLTLTVGGMLQQVTKKTHKLSAKEISLVAEDTFTIKVGSASLTFKKSGDIVIKGAKIEMTASGDVIIKGSKIADN